MSKLPSNMLATPKFDSPLRRTEGQGAAAPKIPLNAPALKSVEGGAAKAQESKPKASAARKRAPKPAVSNVDVAQASPEEALDQRFSLRLTQEQFRALETRVFERKMAGDKLNAASLLREILDAWVVAQS